VLMPAIVSLGLPALDEVARENRSAAKRLLSITRTETVSRLPSLASYQNMPISERGTAVTSDASRVYVSTIHPVILLSYVAEESGASFIGPFKKSGIQPALPAGDWEAYS
jgi:hypothetical protein